MNWHFYLGRADELLLDLDSDWKLSYAKEKLSRNEYILGVRAIRLYRSGSLNHYHMIVTLRKPMAIRERAVWELHLGSDLTRGLYVLMRIDRGIDGIGGYPDFLIANRAYAGWRKPDRVCECCDKHKAKEITDNCPVLQEILADEASAQYFAIKPKATLPEGRIPLNQIFKTEKE